MKKFWVLRDRYNYRWKCGILFFDNEEAQTLITELKERQLNMTYLQAEETVNQEASAFFSEKTVVLTGN